MPPHVPPFADVYAQYKLQVYRFCLSQVRDVAAADDVAADVFVAAFAAYERTRPDADGVRAWLFAIARNTIVDRARKAQRWRRFVEALAQKPAPSLDVEALVGIRAELQDVMAAMGRLRKRDSTLIGLRYVAQLSFADIGAALGMSEKSASTITYRALERLRAELGTGDG